MFGSCYVCVVSSWFRNRLSYLILIDGSCSVSLQVFSACLLPLNSTSQTAWAADCLASRSMPFDTHSLLPLFFLAPVAFVAGMCLTTLARLPFRLGLGRVWTPSVILRTLSPICNLVRTRILFRFPLLFGSLYCIYLCLDSLESLLYICSFGIYCKLLRCNHL